MTNNCIKCYVHVMYYYYYYYYYYYRIIELIFEYE